MGLKPRYVALTFSGLILVFSAILLSQAKNRPLASLPTEPRHPVTNAMLTTAEQKAKKQAPFAELDLAGGGKFVLTEALKKGPVVIVFTKEDCPCSMESQPVWNELARGFADRATFVGVSKNPAEMATKFRTDFNVPYAIGLDPKQEVIKAFEAINSVYVALISQDGKVYKMWPGYNKAMVSELNALVGKLSGGTTVAATLDTVPEKLSSGCSFAE
jgi:peroxiredoxin